VSRPDLSVVIPLRDERPNVVPLWRELEGCLEDLGRSFEVILADDGSLDGTGRLIDEISSTDPRLRPLHLESASGQSAALLAGFRAARGNLILTMDGDLQCDPSDIGRMLESLGTLDALIGFRARREDSLPRIALSGCANRVRNLVLRESIRDTGCPMKLMRRQCVESLRPFDGMHRLLPALFRLEGFQVGQIAVGHRPRRWGRSKYGPGSRLLRPVCDLLAVRWMQRRRVSYRLREEIAPTMPAARSSRAG